MKIGVIGTGAVGGYFGSLLFKSGVDITFVGTPVSERMIKEDGLVVNSERLDVKVTSDASLISDAELILVAVKSYHLQEVGLNLKSISSNSLVICLQNGVDNDLTLKKYRPELDVHPGLVYVSAKKVSPGVIFQSGPQKTLMFGRRDHQIDQRFFDIEKYLVQSEIDAIYSKNIQKDMWQKYIFVISFAAATARFRSDIGTVFKTPEMKNYYLKSLQEVINIAKAEGVLLDADIFEKTYQGALNFPSNTKSSLLVDLENHRQTEIQTLHGTVVSLAEKHGIPAPSLREVLNCVY